MKLHYVEWTEDRSQNNYWLATIPVGDALATLPLKSDRKIVQIIMPMPYNEGFYTIRLYHRHVVVDGKVVDAWVKQPLRKEQIQPYDKPFHNNCPT